MAFIQGFKKIADGWAGGQSGWGGKTINDMIGNPFGSATKPKTPLPPPQAPKNVAVGGKTLGQVIGFPGS